MEFFRGRPRGGRRGRAVRPNKGFNREGLRGDRADPIGECGIEKDGLKEAGGHKSFESFKVKGFCKDCLTVEKESLKEKDFKGMKDKGFKGFGEKDFEENCFGVKKKRSSKEEGFRSLKEEGFVLSFENEMKCGVCAVEEELDGATVFPGGVASKAPPGRVQGLGDKMRKALNPLIVNFAKPSEPPTIARLALPDLISFAPNIIELVEEEQAVLNVVDRPFIL